MQILRLAHARPLAVCGLAFALAGCAAAPLAQVAVSDVSRPPPPTCVAGIASASCQPPDSVASIGGSMGNIAQGIGQAIQPLTSRPPAPAPGSTASR